MINNVVLVGRTTKDPELRYTPSNSAQSYKLALFIKRLTVQSWNVRGYHQRLLTD